MLQIVILCVAALFMGNCESAEFEILIDGVNIGRSSSCVGENVTYICNITSSSHVWSVPGNTEALAPISATITEQGYTFRVVSSDGNSFVSSLSVNSSAGLNGTIITCQDGTRQDGDIARTVVIVLDSPSIPMLSVSVENIETLNITVTPPSVSPVCVLQYIITNSSNCDSTVTNITVDPAIDPVQTNIMMDLNTDPTQPVQFTIGGLNLCACSYNFTVAADTMNGIGETSNSLSRGSLSTAINDPDLNINTSDFYVTILVTAPEMVTIIIKYTNMGSTNVSLDEMKMNGMAEGKTLLECGLTNRRVDFFVEFTSQCGMKSITDTTSPLPRLISSFTQSTSTISSIHLLLAINDCLGKEQLIVISSVSDIDGVLILSVNTSINGMITFESLPADKNYICNVSIIEGSTILDSMNISCGTSSTSMSSDSPPIIIIAIVIVCCVVLIVIVAVLAYVIYLKKKKGAGSGVKKEKSTPSYQEAAFTSSTNGSDTTTDIGATKNNPPTYQDPSTIKHETAADGDVYTMIDKKPKKKKGKEEKDDVAAMYSMPDKSKKNPELTYADIEVSNPQRPPNNRGIGNRSVFQQDTSSVTYASVESPATKF